MKMKASTSRKLRYGGVTAVLTALVIAAVIIFNVIFSALAGKLRWYVDLTPELLFTLSDECITLLENGDPSFSNSSSPIKKLDELRAEKRAADPNFKDEDLMIDIIFCDDPDAWLYESALQRYVYDTALQLQAEFPDHIRVRTHNIVWNPTAVSKYGEVTRTSVIVECGTEFRTRSLSNFYMTDTGSDEPWAYNGEKIFASLILAVTRAESPIACLTTNHGESVPEELVLTLTNAGYKILPLDLAETSETDPDHNPIPEDCRLIVVFNPKTDFMVKDGVSEVDEIERLERFLDGTNSMMVFMSPETTSPLTNFESYLEEWGISYDRHSTLEGGKTTYHPYMVKDSSQSLTVDGFTVVGEYYTQGMGGSMTKSMRENVSTPPSMVFPNAMSISFSSQFTPQHYVDPEDSTIQYDYATSSADGTYRSIYDVFVSSENAVAMANGQEIERATALNPLKLMTVSMEERNTQENDYDVINEASYVIACGTTDFAATNILQSPSYGNNRFLEYSLRVIGHEPVPVGLTQKPFGDYTIDTITTKEATQYTVVLTVIPAVLALGSGIFVLVRRKNR